MYDDDKYSLKFTPDMRPFASIRVQRRTVETSKANATKLVLAGYDFAIEGIRKTTSDQLSDQIELFSRFNLTTAMVLAKDFEHRTHQRGQNTVYL